jgi:DNA-binding CsgD family transcriptional regulator
MRFQVMARLRTVVPWDAWCWPTADPATFLVTGAAGQGIPPDRSERFFQIEYQVEDYNKFAELAKGPRTIRSLAEATGSELEKSARYREVFGPMGIGEDLRAALRVESSCWGYLVLHRDPAKPFTDAEVAYVAQLAEHLAEGLRTALLIGNVPTEDVVEGPGMILLGDDMSVNAMTPTAQYWMQQTLTKHAPLKDRLPDVVYAVANRLRALENADEIGTDLMPRSRVPTRSGRWVVVHASRLSGPKAQRQIGIIMEPARPAEMAQLILEAYELTKRESQIAQGVLRGLSTEDIASDLKISAQTVQQHLKAVFDKVGVRSRRELMGHLFSDQYWPRMKAREKLGADGWFAQAVAGVRTT